MATSERKRKDHLKAIPGGKTDEQTRSAIDDLFSGKVSQPKGKVKRGKKEAPPVELPKKLQSYADVYAAGQALEREIRFKTDFARRKINEYGLADIAKQYAAINRRPSSRNYSAKHSRFKFVFTQRTTLTEDKVEELKSIGIDIEEYTDTQGIRIDYNALREHKLEIKLREALRELRVSQAVLKEIFTPQVVLKDSFYDVFAEIVRNSLEDEEDLEEKTLKVLQILNPNTQMRNVEVVGLTPEQSFKLVNDIEIQAEDEIA